MSLHAPTTEAENELFSVEFACLACLNTLGVTLGDLRRCVLGEELSELLSGAYHLRVS